MRAFEPEAKIGLLATVGAKGYPHLTLITSLQARTPTGLMFGQFSEGLSKNHVKDNPHTGFLVMNRSRELWRGRAHWQKEVKAGEDYELYNRKPMFRYNSYFGIHTVHYLDLVDFTDKEILGVPAMLAGALMTAVASRLETMGDSRSTLKPWAKSHVSKASTLKFLASIDEDGFPRIIPAIPSRAAENGRLVISLAGYGRELESLTDGVPVCVLALNMQMESVLVGGRLRFRRRRGLKTAVIDIEWVYNSMPPKQGFIYPAEPLEAVSAF